jgi:hypothetical protein
MTLSQTSGLTPGSSASACIGFSHKTLEELPGELMKLKSSKPSFPAKVMNEA